MALPVICAALILGAWMSPRTVAQEATLHPFAYHEGFEGPAPDVTMWASNGEVTVNFLGPTEERAFQGRRSLKLDVSIQSGSYHYWGVAVRVPCAGKLRMSARIWVDDESTAQVGFGANYLFPPTHHSGCTSEATFGKPTGEWKAVEVDLVENGRAVANGVMRGWTTTVKGDNVGVYLDRWALFIYGGAQSRAVVYLDDVRIEGEVPDEATYTQEIQQRWAGTADSFRAQMAGLSDQLQQAVESISALQTDADPARLVAQRTLDQVRDAQANLERLLQAGYASQSELDQIQAAVSLGSTAPRFIAAISQAHNRGQPGAAWAVQAITNDRLPPDAPIPIAFRGTELTCSGCRGEYESLSAVLYAFQDLQAVQASVSDLQGPGGAVIPASAVDVRIVKWWYQAGKEIWDLANKMLVPELLLKDDQLVRVDTAEQANYLRSTAEDGTETYLLCSGPTSDNLEGVRPVDAQELQPVNVPAGTLKQFWLTVHIPEDAAPGDYQGQFMLHIGGATISLPLRVTVHRFDLAPPSLTYSIYYRATLSPDNTPTIGSEQKSEEQYRAELEDLKAHGVTYPTNYHGWDDRLRRVLEIRREVGLPGGPFFNLGRGTGAPTTEAELEALRQDVIRWIELCREFGYDTVYFYGIDEATGDLLLAQREAWRAVQEAGGKTFVACYEGTFEAMGSLLNCAVHPWRPNPEIARKWHSVGSQVFCYAFPQVGNEEPETYRRNFGVWLWKAGYDGAMNYAYQHGFHHVWNDFDDPWYRDHNFTYPTINGVVGTIQWEGFREAVDDVRYLTTLEQAVASAGPERAEVAAQARAWLDSLEPEWMNLDQVRAQAVEWIEKLLPNQR